MKCRYDTVIFDLDGTLLNTLEDLADSVNYAVGKAGMPLLSMDDIRSFVGNGVERLLEQCVPKGKENAAFGAVLSDFRAHYSRHCNDKTKPYEGILELLDELKRRGYRMGIVSNKYYQAVQELKKLYFEGLISTAVGETSDIRRKPAPDTVQKALEEMGGCTGEAVLVGDSEVDILTAQNAGMDCICVTWGFRGKEELKRAGGTLFADSPMEILNYIG